MDTTELFDSSRRDERLNEVFAEFMRAVDSGQKPDREAWIARYPEFAADLKSLFAAEDDVMQAAAEPPAPQPRTVRYFGDYELLEELGRGGMGVVYKARQVSLKRLVAVKLILDSRLAGESEVKRFHLEAEAAANLQHPGIVPVYEVGNDSGRHYFSMAYIEGTTLAALLRDHPLPPTDAARYVRQVAEAIHYAHQHHTLHRDIKPSNILVDRDDQPHITDFGLAKRVADDSGVTATGAILGTPSYMAPEQASSRQKDLGPATDVYSLGATLYALLAGRPPFQAASAIETVQQVIRESPVSPRVLNPTVPRDLETICLKCLEKDPQQRYATAEELAEELRRWSEGKPIKARPVTTLERGWRWCRRNPVVAGLIATVAIALAVGTVISSSFAVKADCERDRANVNAQRADIKANEAEANAKRADGKAREAEEEKRKAENEKRRALRQLADFYIERASKELQQGDPLLAFAVFGQAYRAAVAVDDAALRRSLCTILGAWLPYYEQRRLVHDGSVGSLAFSPDGTKVATVASDGTVRLWDVVTGRPLVAPMRHDDAVSSIVFSPDGATLATASEDKTARLWNALTGQPLARPMQHADKVTDVAFSPDGKKVATASSDKTARLWDAATGQSRGLPMRHDDAVIAVAFSADGERLVTASVDKTARLWNAASGGPVGQLMKHDGKVRAAAFSPDGKKVATASSEGAARLWDAATGAPLGPPLKHRGEVACVAFSPDGTRIVTGSSDDGADGWNLNNATPEYLQFATLGHHYDVCQWDTAGGHSIGGVMELGGFVHQVAFSPDGAKIVAACGDHTATVWDAMTNRSLGQLTAHDDQVLCARFSSDGATIATCSRDKTARLWSMATERPAAQPRQIDDNLTVSAFTSDARRFLTCKDNEVRIWSTATLQPLGEPIKHSERVIHAAFSPDGTQIATGSCDKTARLWNAVTGQALGPPILHDGNVWGVAFSPDGKTLATGSDGRVRLWDAATRKPRGAIAAQHGSVQCFTFSPDCVRLAVATADQTVRLWTVADFKPAGSPMRHDADVVIVLFSPDGAELAAATSDGTVHVWSARTCQPVGVPMRHSERVTAMEFSPDGRVLATASGSGGSIRLWDAGTCQPLAPPPAYGGTMNSLSVFPDGSSRSGTVTILSFTADGARLMAGISGQAPKWWPLPQALPDEPLSVSTCLEVISNKREGSDGVIRRISDGELEEAWRQAAKPHGWLDSRRQIESQREFGWHYGEARLHVTLEQWYAAAFHLRWLCKMQPERAEWQKTLLEVRRRLAEADRDARLKRHTALRFSDDTQSARTANSGTLNLTEPLTVEAWIYPYPDLEEAKQKFIVSKNMNGTGYCLTVDPQSPPVLGFDGGKTPITDGIGRWIHVAAVRENGTLKLYMDGELKSTANSLEPLKPNNEPFWIGSSPFGCGWRGAVDEVRVWRVARTQADIRATMYRHLSGKEPGLTAYWDFDEPGKKTVPDLTGHGNDLSLDYGKTKEAMWCEGVPLAPLDPKLETNERTGKSEDAASLPKEPSAAPAEELKALGAEKLTDGWCPRWSPDGKKILFSQMPDGAGVGVFNLDARSVKTFMRAGKDAAWSPAAGGPIAFVRNNQETEEIWLMDPSGANPRRVAEGGFPSWSTSGAMLFFHNRRASRVMGLNLAKGEPGALAPGPNVAGWYPVVSPDAGTVAVVQDHGLEVIDLKSGGTLKHWPTSWGGGAVGWSPDGKWIGFGAFGLPDHGMWLLNLNDEKAYCILPGPCTCPAWSPDGKRIAFDMRAGQSRSIWLVPTSLVYQRYAAAAAKQWGAGQPVKQ